MIVGLDRYSVFSAEAFHKMVDDIIDSSMKENVDRGEITAELIRECVLQSVLWHTPVAGNA